MTDNEQTAADALAKRAIEQLIAQDSASPSLGMEIIDIGYRRATVTMPVIESMLNGSRVCHGGFIFALADSTFAFACNSENYYALAQHCGIEFLRPAHEGDVLTATATARHQGKTTGVYDINVTNQESKLVAVMRGNSFRLGTKILEEEA